MHKNTLWYATIFLIIYFTLVFCEPTENSEAQLPNNHTQLNQARDLVEVESRTRRRHGFHHHLWGWHALAIAYWIKVKVVIVAFFVGSAVFVGLRYFWPHKCTPEIVYDHPPPSYHEHHDHIPYSFDHSDHFSDHSFDSSSFEPYSGYSSYSTGPDVTVSDVSPTGPSETRRGRRSVPAKAEQQERQMPPEEQIAELMFSFLGLDSKGCRRRFVCEMEFRSKENPLSSMAFRLIGRGLFANYINARNPLARATSFNECAAANPECVFIEHHTSDEHAVVEDAADSSQDAEQQQAASDDNKQDNEVSTAHNLEAENEENLQAERRHVKRRHHQRGDRKLSLKVAEHILTQHL